MKLETTLSQTLYTAGNNSDYDAACKRLLSEKIILAWIMKNCLEEYRDCNISEIIENYIEGEPQIAEIPIQPDQTNTVNHSLIRGGQTEDKTITEGTITYDIRFMATAPKSGELIRLIINVEAQNNFYPGYPLIKRGIYYCSRMISAQYGTEFSASHYEDIKKVYSIWICMNPPKYRKNSINRYSITEEQLIGSCSERKENYDLLTAIMICLGDSDDENVSGILKLLEVLLSSNREVNEKKKILQNDFSIEMTKTLEREVSIMCNLSKGVEEKGIEKGILLSIRNLMETMGWSAEQAMKGLKIPEEEKGKYLEALKKN